MPLQVSPRGTPTLPPARPVGSITYGHTGVTSVGCWVEWLEKRETGREEAAEEPGDIWKGPQGGNVGIVCAPWVS